MAVQLDKIEALMTADVAPLRAAFGQAANASAEMEKALDRAARSTSGVEKAFALAGKGVAAAAVGVLAAASAISAAAGKLVGFGSRMTDISAQTGVGVEALQRFEFAGEMVGVTAEEVGRAVNLFQKNLVAGATDTADALSALGLSAESLKKMSPEEQLATLTETISKLPDPAERSAAAMTLLGRSGASLVPLGENIRGVMARADELGVVMSKDAVAAADRLDDKLAELGSQWDALVMQLGRAITESPAVASALDGISGALQKALKWVEDNQEAIGAFVSGTLEVLRFTLGLVVDGIMAVVNAIYKIGVAIGAITPSMEDLDEHMRRLGVIEPKRRLVTEKGLKDVPEKMPGFEKPFSAAEMQAALRGANAAKMMREGLKLGAPAAPAPETKVPTFDPAAAAKAREEAEKLAKAAKEAAAAMTQLSEESLKELEESMRLLGPTSADVLEGFLQLRAAASAFGGTAQLTTPQLSNYVGELQKLIDTGMASSKVQDEHAAATAELGQRFAFASEVAARFADAAGAAAAGVGATVGPTERAQKASVDWRQALADVAAQFQALGGVGNLLGTIAGGIAAVGAQVQKLNKDVSGGGLKGAKGLGGFLGKLSAGFAIGSAALSIGRGLFDALTSSPAEKAAKEAGRILGQKVSEEMGQQIVDTAKRLGISTGSAALLFLNESMEETGRSAHEMGAQVMQLMASVASGAIPAAAGVSEIGEAFAKVAEEAEKGVGDQLRVQMIQTARAAGLAVPEITAAVAEALQQATAGVEAVTKGIPLVSQADATSQAQILAATFWATVRESGIVAAATALKPAFDQLTSSLEAGGFDASAVLAPIQNVMALLGSEATSGIVEGIQGLQDALGGLADSGYMTVGAFQGIEQQAASAFAQLQAEGVASDVALQAIAPLLAQLQSAAQNYGLELDSNTQALIDQASAAGVAFPTDPLQQIVDILKVIATQLGADIPASAAATKASFGDTSASVTAAAQQASGSWQQSATSTVAAAQGARPGVEDAFFQMADYAKDRGEYVSQQWNQTGSEIGMFIADSIPAVTTAFDGLEEAATAPLAAIRKELDKVADAAQGASDAVAGLGGAFSNLPSGPGGGPGPGQGPGGSDSGVPQMQEGGVLTEPQLVMAGEVPEAIVPLELLARMGGPTTVGPVYVTVPPGTSPAMAEQIVAAGIKGAVKNNLGGTRTVLKTGLGARRGRT